MSVVVGLLRNGGICWVADCVLNIDVNILNVDCRSKVQTVLTKELTLQDWKSRQSVLRLQAMCIVDVGVGVFNSKRK